MADIFPFKGWTREKYDEEVITSVGPHTKYRVHRNERRCDWNANTLTIWVAGTQSKVRSRELALPLDALQNNPDREAVLYIHFRDLSRELADYEEALAAMEVIT